MPSAGVRSSPSAGFRHLATTHPPIVKFLQMRLVVSVSSEWLDLCADLQQQLQNGGDPWPSTTEVALRFKRPQHQEPSEKRIQKLSIPASLAPQHATSATSVKNGPYTSHSLNVSEFCGHYHKFGYTSDMVQQLRDAEYRTYHIKSLNFAEGNY